MGEAIKIRALEDHDATQSEALGETYSRKWKQAATRCVAQAVYAGALIRPEKCSDCGEVAKVQAHHRSYALDDWRCASSTSD